jgi:AICAR transformylase/IMP cyclohydrolase PurH
MADFNGKLGRKKEEAIVALCSTRSIEDAARACNTPVRTLYRWLKEPEFDAAYRAARRSAYGQSIARLQQASTAAATTLLKVMVDPTTPPSTRVRAAESVLTHAAKAIEIEDLDARLTDLERANDFAKDRRPR